MRAEYRREDLGPLVRGKYARFKLSVGPTSKMARAPRKRATP